jgi:hypothetical protein
MVADREIQNSRNPYVNHWPELGKRLAVLNGGLWVKSNRQPPDDAEQASVMDIV